MYSLKEAWIRMHGSEPVADWDGKIYCAETDAAITFRANRTHGYMSAYTFTLVLGGTLNIVYNGQQLTLGADDLYIYSPGMSVDILSASDDYRGICLLADEFVTIDTPAAHDLVHMAYQPFVQLNRPKLTLRHDDALSLAVKMKEIIHYLHSDHIYKQKILQMQYAVFLLDMQNAQDRAIAHRSVTGRVEDIFIGFIRLLPKHFSRHHDIAFYASELNISKVYLSRVVRQVAGRTVVDYINQFLTMEASFLLKTTDLSVMQIAERLNFADIASFSKFFLRNKGMSPKSFREEG